MNKIESRIIFFFYIIPIPLFLSADGVYKGSSLDTDVFALPISLIVSLILIFMNLGLLKTLFHRHNLMLLLFAIYSFFVFLLKIAISGSILNTKLLLISILPLIISYCFGYNFKQLLMNIDIRKYLKKMVIILSFICLTHILSSFLSFGLVGAFANRGEDSIFGLFSIYQKFIYYPTMLACCFLISLFIKSKYKWVFSPIILIDIIIVASREAIIISLLSLIFFLYFQIKKIYVKNLINFLIICIIGSSLIFFYSKEIRNIYESATIVTKFKSLNESGDVTAGRSQSMKHVFDNSRNDFNYLTGTGYSMSLGDFRSPHNQYAEILLRSGCLGLIIFLIFIIITLNRMMLNVKYYSKTNLKYSIYSLSLVYMCLILISFNINVPVRAPYTAILFGFISGFFNNIDFYPQTLDDSDG